ncbi:aspartate-semialdehyde dehydrogenase [Thiohalophilus thiocyanatoxydans]|uniref:Aspartate-semialdehyde dehydrogenase n=1 Tax=Thiohalophilus thiocyanatoxydans TaxID=381308 RepID=A0A4R8IRA4_9GAMM|nr:aspartate-semialdehyde dehydrogenase [Thiohalophilus thiocyanatoxydans]TDY00029.1 aspartate semialdehyde dehydrogenase [Thiohalophilus thiocyanatoxydans]
MSKQVDIAIVGVTGAVGEVMLEILEQRDFPVGTIYPLASANSAGKRVEFRGKSLVVRELADFDFSQVQLALFCAGETVAAEYAPRAAAAGCVVIDNSARFRGDASVPLVIPEVNPRAIAGYTAHNIIASPDATTVQLWVALKPIYDTVGIERLNVATYQAVSGSGKAGVQELAGQTANLLNAQPLKNRVYDRQIAFNALAQIEAVEENGYTRGEMNLVRESHKILASETLAINPTAVRVPVFYGHGMAVHLETRDKLGARQARALLEEAPGITLMDEGREHSYPSAVTDAANANTVLVGRIREDISHPRGLDLWIVSDNVRKGAALNSVQVAEILVKEYL